MRDGRWITRFVVVPVILLTVGLASGGRAAQGLTGLYWNAEFQSPESISGTLACDPVVVDKIDFTFGQGLHPHGVTSVNVEHWTARYVGFINIPTAGTYRFRTTTDDGVNLIIDDTIVFRNSDTDKYPYWRHQAHENLAQECIHATGDGVHPDLTLTDGYHRIKFEYWEWSGARATDADPCKLEWAGPPTGGLTTFQVVPLENLATACYSREPDITVSPITPSATEVDPGSQVTFTITASDADTRHYYDVGTQQFADEQAADTTLSVQWTGPNGQTLVSPYDPSNSYSFTCTAPSGTESFTVSVTVSDGSDEASGRHDDGQTKELPITVRNAGVVTWKSSVHSYSSPVSGDLDGDGLQELVVVGTDGKLHVWKNDGSYAPGVPGWPQNISAGYFSGLTKWPTAAIGDIDGDGSNEIAVGSPDSPYMYAFNGDGTLVPGWPQQTSYGFRNAPTVADVDCDGIADATQRF